MTTATIERPSYAERCQRECTRSVIFLFQVRDLRLIGLPEDFSLGPEGRGPVMQVCDCDGKKLAEPIEWSIERLVAEKLTFGNYDTPCVVESWRTEGVFLSREEAENFGKRTEYRYSHGFRVHGVPAEGELATLIEAT